MLSQITGQCVCGYIYSSDWCHHGGDRYKRGYIESNCRRAKPRDDVCTLEIKGAYKILKKFLNSAKFIYKNSLQTR